MQLLAPLALLWLGSVPILFWLWRLSTTRRQLVVPSLVPFEGLLKRAPQRRSQLIVNILFWLQLATLIGVTLSLAQPVVWHQRGKVCLAILDTSASMDAHLVGATPFARAKEALLNRLARSSPTTQVLLMTTSPISAPLSQPTSDRTVLAGAIRALHVSPLGGNLTTTARIGRALLGKAPDQTWIFTDEPVPSDPLGSGVQIVSLGQPLPNVAIVELGSHATLCTPADTHVSGTLQNFANGSTTVTVVARQQGRVLTQTQVELAPHARSVLSLTLPEQTTGWVDVAISSPQDALAIDNHAWVELHPHATQPIVLHAQTPRLRQTLAAWLDACPALTWSPNAPSTGSYLLVTDHEENQSTVAAGILRVELPHNETPVLAHWIPSAEHPINAYLAPLGLVRSSVNRSPAVPSGVPVLWAIVDGQKVPLLVTEVRTGQRIVSMLFDPTSSADPTPMLLTFLNSLRWLMTDPDVARLGQRNFFDPLESNTLERISTWRAPEAVSPSTTRTTNAPYPLSSLLTFIALIVLLIEWALYCAKGQAPQRP